MTDRDDMRVAKALQGARFPAERSELLRYAEEREVGAQSLAALRTIPDRTYESTQDVVDMVAQEPEGGDEPGGTDRG